MEQEAVRYHYLLWGQMQEDRTEAFPFTFREAYGLQSESDIFDQARKFARNQAIDRGSEIMKEGDQFAFYGPEGKVTVDGDEIVYVDLMTALVKAEKIVTDYRRIRDILGFNKIPF